MGLLAYVQGNSMKRLHEIREYIDAQTDIIKIKTHVVLSEWIDNQG
ncbi:transcriptional regulator, AsnC family [Shewanella sediminis HAW-EB3]|uniref:Transcriptional regulator, AsnC family n=1 Tax=Shewanella sediminis (strain HAW-EB3) TaxID=425104 RepID=A8FPT5_SHESH|nr:transcriptional regulator, AsnC family [Shewanella sediminis HAW-EB3]